MNLLLPYHRKRTQRVAWQWGTPASLPLSPAHRAALALGILGPAGGGA